MRYVPHMRRGILGSEVMVSLSILAMIAILAVDGVVRYRHAVNRYDCRRAAAWVAEAQWLRHRAGAPLDSLPPEGVVPEGITLATSARAGHGQWEGFQLVTVKVTAVVPSGGQVHEEVSGYLRSEGKP